MFAGKYVSQELLEWAGSCGWTTVSELLLHVYEWWRERPLELAELSVLTEKMNLKLRLEETERFQKVMEQMESLHLSGRIKASGTAKRMETIVGCAHQLPEQGSVLFEQVSRNVAVEAKPLFEQLSFWKQNELWRDLFQDRTVHIRQGLLTLLSELELLYGQVKQEQGWVDFTDLQRMAYRMLRDNSIIRQWYSSQYMHILVDEYQDTNPIQQAILDMLDRSVEEASMLFMVGDARQSIYRFRGADVSGFERMRKETTLQGTCIELQDNFRACPALGAFTAEWSSRLFGEQSHSTSHSGDVSDSVVELLLPDTAEGDNLHAAEADLLARRICEIPYSRWGGIAILLQARTHLSHYERALQDYQIPYTVHGEMGYWERQEVLDIFHLLRVVDDPGDAVALLGYLRGPIVGLSDEALWRIAEKMGLVEGFLSERNFGGEDADRRRLENARCFLEELRKQYYGMGLLDWLYMLLREKGVAKAVGLHDLEPLLRMVEEMERRGEVYLSDLLKRWQESARDATRQDCIAEGIDSGNRIRIMTIHAAKGLEFSIVFVPDLSHRFSHRTEPVQMSDQWGLTVKYGLGDTSPSLYSLTYEQARLEERRARNHEQKRLLYVAITRAKEQLILSSTAAEYSNKNSLEDCSNWFDWLPFLQPALRQGLQDGHIIAGYGWNMQVRRHIAGPYSVLCSNGLLKDTMGATISNVVEVPIESAKRMSPIVSPSAVTIWSVTDCMKRLARSEDQRQESGYFKSKTFMEHAILEDHEWGRILHHVLEHIRPDDNLETIRSRRINAALAEAGLTGISEREAAWDKLGSSIAAYLKGELHRECNEAIILHSELPFTCRLFQQEGSSLYVNGVIDKVWLRKDGKATLIDVKTHQIRTQKQFQQIVRSYSPQIQLYAYAVEKLLGWKIDRAGLYLTAKQEFVEVPCGDLELDSLLGRLDALWLEGDRGRTENKDSTGLHA